MKDVKLVLRDNQIEVVEPKRYLSSKDVIQSIKNFERDIEKQGFDIEQMENSIKNAKNLKEENEKYLKQIKKHEEWALKDQDKLLRNLVTKDIIEKTKEGFKLEDDLKFTEEEKKKLNYYRFKRQVFANPEISEKVHISVIEKKANENDLIPNHF